MNELILAVAITGSITFGLGIALGMSLQWRRSEAYIAKLEGELLIIKRAFWGAYDFWDNELDDEYNDWDDDQYETDKALMQAGAHE